MDLALQSLNILRKPTCYRLFRCFPIVLTFNFRTVDFSLPNEIWHLILCYFDLVSLVSYRTVCRQWRDAIKKVPVSINGDRLITTESYESITSSFGHIAAVRFNRNEQLSCPLIIKFMKQCTKLLKIESFGTGLHDLLYHVPNPKLLETVQLPKYSNYPISSLVNLQNIW
jgi:hypothetical protein